MQITIELPEDIALGLASKWKDLSRAALESLALEACRSNALSTAQLRRLLGFETRMKVDAFFEGARSLQFHGGRLRAGSRNALSGSGRGTQPPCVVRGETKCHPVDWPSSAHHFAGDRILLGKTANMGG
jgi:hypothetical protein